MKNLFKLKAIQRIVGILTLAIMMGFTMTACESPAGGDTTDDNKPPVTNPGGDDTPRNNPPGDPVAVTGVTLNKTTLNIIAGKTETLTATVAPANATNKGLTWESSNTATATVANGAVTAVAAGSTTITVKTNDGEKTATCAVTVYPAPDSIAVTTPLTKSWCVVGDTLADIDLTGMVVTATHGGGTYSVPLDMLTITGLNTAIAGTNNITISFGGKNADPFTITVVSITSVTVTPKTTIRVALNEPLNSSVLDNLTVTATYSDDKGTEDITSRITLANITGFSSATTGVKSLTVSYRNVTSNTFTVTVVEVTGISIASNPTKTRYAIGEPIDLTGMTVTVTYSDTSTGTITPTTANITGFSSAAATASQTVTVTYSGKTTTLNNIKVYATVTFNPNGGNWSGDTGNKTVETEGNAAVTPPADPARNNYAFDDWYTQATGGTKVNFANLITTNQTYYAQWKPSYAVTFNLNGGTLNSSTDNQTRNVVEGNAVANPGNPTRARATFVAWYTHQTGGTEYNFATLITAPITLYARWNFTLPLTDVTDVVPYLETLTTGGSAASPASLPVNFALGTMTQGTSGWQLLLGAIDTAGKFVELNLSPCTMTGTEFNPVNTVSTGKDKIVTIALPTVAASIGPNGSNTAIFNNFTALTSFSQTGTALKTIGNNAFYQMTSLTQTTLPTGVTSIGDFAFYGTNLALTALPAGIESIGGMAFGNCVNIVLTALPTGLKTIGANAFYNCAKLTLTSLPAGITSINTAAFSNCVGITSLSIPASVSITDNPFNGCTSLVLFTVTGTGGTLSTIENGKALVRSNNTLMSYPSATGAITLPETITAIAGYALRDCRSLTQITLPSSLASIGNYAFVSTGITQITLPASLASIGQDAFSSCSDLVLVTCLRSTPPTISTYGFNGTHANLAIKVPAASLNAYQTAPGWSTYADRISAQ